MALGSPSDAPSSGPRPGYPVAEDAAPSPPRWGSLTVG
jgi:hypothetical protein